MIHPCLKCGACCAFFRVSMHWSETLAVSHGVPLLMTTNISPHQKAMLGTDQKNPSCIALEGLIGKTVSCGIYANRPNSCRAFKASFEDGSVSLGCEKARIGKGLEILTLADWVN